MRYGHFDNANREYVIERPDVPVSWTNYLGVENLCTVLSHNAGGYSFYKHAEHQRVTRFRPNGVPLDRPGHYVYLRDDDTGEYWSISWQPVGKDLAQAQYECRHGLSYSRFSCDYQDLHAEQTIFIPLGDDVELWDVRIRNNGADAAPSQRLLVPGVFLPPHRNRQPESADEPVRQRIELRRRHHRVRFLLRTVDVPLLRRQLPAR